MIRGLVARVLGDRATLTITYVPCMTCGTRTPADADGWDTDCPPCAEEQRLAAARRVRQGRYCWKCDGPHKPNRVHLNDPYSNI